LARRILLALFALPLAIVLACSDDPTLTPSTPTPSPTVLATATATATPNTTPTPSATAGPTITATAIEDAPGDRAFSAERALAHIDHLSNTIGPRVGGTDGEREAAEYIAEQFRTYGYDTSIEPFSFEGFIDRGSTLAVSGGSGPPVRALHRSAAGTVTAPLVAAGIGRSDEFPADAAGAIAVVTRGTIEFGEKVANAERAGAVGVIVVNNEPGEFRGALSSVSAIPAVTIAQADGQALLAMAGTTATLAVDTFNGQVDSANVVARAAGGECRVLAGGHYDSVPHGPGAHDNASGTAVVLELARVLGPLAAEGACFAAFGSEEIGLEGSKAFVNAMTARERRSLDVMLNFDMVGIGTTWTLIGTSDLVQEALAFADRASIAAVPGQDPPGSGSDHASFFNAGVPVLFFFAGLDPNYHTPNDRIDFISAGRLAEAGAMGEAAIERALVSAT